MANMQELNKGVIKRIQDELMPPRKIEVAGMGIYARPFTVAEADMLAPLLVQMTKLDADLGAFEGVNFPLIAKSINLCTGIPVDAISIKFAIEILPKIIEINFQTGANGE